MSARLLVPRTPKWRALDFEWIEPRILLDGALDPSFGNAGVTTIPFDLGGFKNDSARAVAIQPDGKIVVAGTADVSQTSNEFAVARLNSDGTLDQTFGQGGKVNIAFSFGDIDNAFAYAVAMDGTDIVVAGSAQVAANSFEMAVARLTPSGSLDPTFNGTGEETFSFNVNANPNETAYAVAVEPGGKIVLAGDALHAGSASSSGNYDFALARLNPDGSLDTTFNVTGLVTKDFDGGFDSAEAVAIEPGGTILVAGTADVEQVPTMVLARYTDQGQLDPTLTDYSAGGEVAGGVDSFMDIDSSSSLVGVVVGQDDSIVVLGSSGDVLKLTSSGTLFDNDASVLGAGGVGEGIALAPDGNVLVAGTTANDAFAVTRLLPPYLTVDPSFGDNGLAVVSVPNDTDAESAALALQDNGDIVVAGSAVNTGENRDFAVARVLGSDAAVPTLAQPSAPSLAPASDTGVVGDGITSITRPELIGSGADPGRTVTLFIGPSNTVLGTTTAAPDGTYSVLPTTPLAVGTYSITADEGDGEGFFGPGSAAFSLTITGTTSQPGTPPTIAPTLVVLTHGQYFDPSLVQVAAESAIAAVLPPVGLSLLAGQISLDVTNGYPITGSGRNGGEQWQYDLAQDVTSQLASAFSGANTGVRSLVVDWDTYGAAAPPAMVVAQRIEQIVADTEFGGLPWNLLFIGYSRGAIFNNDVIQDLNLPSNPRTGYTEAVLLDPTAALPAGDIFPTSVPAGVAKEIVYDDGYAFPFSKVGGSVLGLQLPAIPLLAVDSNTARIPGAEYFDEENQIRTYEEAGNSTYPDSAGSVYSGDSAHDSMLSHAAVPYWYYNYPNNPADPDSTQFNLDMAACIAAIDGGTAPPALAPGQASEFKDLSPYDATLNQDVEVIQPPSTAPDFSNAAEQIASAVYALYERAVTTAEADIKAIVAQAKALGGEIAAQAKALGNKLVAQAKAEGAQVLAAAKQEASKLEKAADAQVKALEAQAKDLANNLYKQGKLFGSGASNQVSAAAKQLTTVENQTQKQVVAAQKTATQAVAAVAKAAAAAKAKAEAAAAAAAAKLAQAKAAAVAAAQAAATKLAVAYAQAQAAATAAAQNLQNKASQAGSAISSGYENTKKKYHL